ncbi:right-handed parallel beta-helix repeat-containing protein, partial [Salinispora arenicola]|nr:right-handed parallel beta-helix repeat-containing protein [Salinispora arenicola]
NNINEEGGGIYSTGPLEIVKSHIDRNTAAFGGGIYSTNSTVAIKGGSISGNQAAIAGGTYVTSGIGTVTGTRITGNTASDTGGVRVATVGQLTLRKVTLADNTAQTVGGLAVSGPTNGGASFGVVEDSIIKNNTATADVGGGIFNGGETVVRDTKVIGNQASRGGGIFNSTTATLDLFSTKIIKNTAVTSGGGIFNTAIGTVNLNTATGTIVIKNRPDNCVGVPGCAG